MAIKSMFKTNSFYVGLSTDTKPTSNQEIGVEFWETDTGKTYRWSGSSWIAVSLVDSAGNLNTSLGTNIAGEDVAADVLKVENRYNYYNITSANTYAIKATSGFLHSITVNTTAAGSIIAYDNTSGAAPIIATLKASVVEGTYIYDVAFTTGLTIVTAAASDITVSYR